MSERRTQILWPAKDTERLKALWAEGRTSGEIVKLFHGRYTRNAIIGKVHRLKGPQRPRGRPSLKWPQERIDRAHKLWLEGGTAIEIAEALGNEVTAGAVAGIARRQDWPTRRITRSTPTRRTARRNGGIATNIMRGVGKAFAKAATPPPEPPRPPTCEPVTLMQRTANQCCWPLGEPNGPDTLYCGAPKDSRSYCAWHEKIGTHAGRPNWTPERRAQFMRSMGLGMSVGASFDG